MFAGEPTVSLTPEVIYQHLTYLSQRRSLYAALELFDALGYQYADKLLAAVEFKLFARGWSPGRVRGVEQDLGKLHLALRSPADVSAAYLCVFQRDVSTTLRRWERYWSDLEEGLAKFSDIRAVFTVCWPKQERDPFVHYSGPWITTMTV